MKGICLGVVLCYLCVSVSYGQEEERFDRLRLEDLIDVSPQKPMQAPGLLGLSFRLPDFKSPLPDEFQPKRLQLDHVLFSGKLNKHLSLYSSPLSPFFNKRVVSGNIGMRYQLKGKISLYLSGNYYTYVYKSPMLPLSASNKEIEAGLSYQLTDQLQLRTGMQYRFNIIKKQWEWVATSGVTFFF